MAEIHELREDLAEIFYETLVEVKTEQQYNTVHSWRGEHRVNTIDTYKVYGKINLDLLSPSQENDLRVFEHWIRSNQKMNIGGFKGVVPVEYDMHLAFDSAHRWLHIRYHVDYIEAEAFERFRRIPFSDVHQKVEPEKPKPVKKAEHFDKDLFNL